MMSMPSARKRAEEFAAAVDGRVSSVAVLDPEMRDFLALVEQLRSVDTARPDPDFSAELRVQLVEAARTELTASPAERRFTERRTRREQRRRRVVSVAAVTCIVTGSGMGVAAASQSALPGDSLYPVKRGLERIELSLAGSSAERGQEYIESADTRLSEVQGLALTRPDELATPALIAETLDEFTAEARAAARALMYAYHHDSSEQSIVDLRTFADGSVDTLDALGTAVPADARDELVLAAQALARIDSAAWKACPACSTLPPLTLPQQLAALQRELAGGTPKGPTVGPPTGGPHVGTPPRVGPSNGPGSGPRQHPPGIGPGAGHTVTHPGPTNAPTAQPTSQAPTTGATAPTATSAPSTSGGQTSGGQPSSVPTGSVSVPTATVSVPTATVSVPTATVSVPTATVSVPTATVSVPTATVSVPTATVSVPTVSVSVPTVTVSVPTVSVSLPTSGVTVPTGGVPLPTISSGDPTDAVPHLLDPVAGITPPQLP